jgi:predicted permease
VLAFTLSIALLTGIIAGLVPAARLSRVNVNEALKQGSRTSSDAAGNRTRGLLVISEVALSLMLLIGAGLMIRSLWMLRNVDPGLDPHNVLAVDPSIPATTFPQPGQEIAFYDQLLQRIRSFPGVQSAGVIDDLPLDPGGGSNQPVQLEGDPVQAMADQPEVAVRLISPGYMRAMHIPLLRGRDFGDQDTPDSPGAVLINQAMAKRLWANEDPLGKHLTMYFFPEKAKEVIGIVGDVKDYGLNAEPPATLYMPLGQLTAGATAAWRSFPLWVVVRTTSNPSGAAPEVINAIHQLNSALPIVDVTTMEDFVANSLSQQRFNMLLLAAFAGLALILAAIGIYSVLAYTVRRRVREIGIRMALGAQTFDVVRLIVSEGMKPTAIGVITGLAASLALGRVLSSLLYGVKPSDLVTLASVSIVLVSVALVASVVPAYRATRVEPVKTLREE